METQKLGTTETASIWVNLRSIDLTCCAFMSICINVLLIYNVRKSFVFDMCMARRCQERLLLSEMQVHSYNYGKCKTPS